MDCGNFGSTSTINQNTDCKWFFVQYDQGPNKIVRKVVTQEKIMWNKHVQTSPEPNESNCKEDVLIRDYNQKFVGHLIQKSVKLEDVLIRNKVLQQYCMENWYKPDNKETILSQMNSNRNFWLLIMYNTKREPNTKGYQNIFEIFHKKEVLLKTRSKLYTENALIRRNNWTYKGIIIKSSNNLENLISTLSDIRKSAIVSWEQIYHFTDMNEEVMMAQEIATMERELHEDIERAKQIIAAVRNNQPRYFDKY